MFPARGITLVVRLYDTTKHRPWQAHEVDDGQHLAIGWQAVGCAGTGETDGGTIRRIAVKGARGGSILPARSAVSIDDSDRHDAGGATHQGDATRPGRGDWYQRAGYRKLR